jgi:hypothetical protein
MTRYMALSFISVLLALAGCKSTGVVQADGDTYMIGKKDGKPGLGVSLSNKADVYSEANDFCHKKGLEVQTVDIDVKSARPAMLGSTELHFRCVPSKDASQNTATPK